MHIAALQDRLLCMSDFMSHLQKAGQVSHNNYTFGAVHLVAGLQDVLTHKAGDAAALRCFRPLPQLIRCLQLLRCIVCVFFLQQKHQ